MKFVTRWKTNDLVCKGGGGGNPVLANLHYTKDSDNLLAFAQSQVSKSYKSHMLTSFLTFHCKISFSQIRI